MKAEVLKALEETKVVAIIRGGSGGLRPSGEGVCRGRPSARRGHVRPGGRSDSLVMLAAFVGTTMAAPTFVTKTPLFRIACLVAAL